ncbi:MAG: CDP-glycerol glycerophosphotransferase family protein [Coriobacteriia bacterium]|nr:CDP-glycerol glycerophosphotransferase family protein [Coriobacteriia bacterium]MCL2536706.1 CDP-glycerol glycerophosphotransferase family protein [Coriobacteriia bacterium]
MKNSFIAFTARALRPFAALFYACIKLLRPQQHKATFISRQSDLTPVDFQLLARELTAQDRSLKIKILCCSDATRGSRFLGNLRQTMLELWHIASSQVVVLDGYALSISYFTQRKSLYVLQMWHALGAIKRFSWQAIDTPGGRNAKIARALRMHANYTALLVGGVASVEVFRHAFRTPRSRIHVLPLPRTDVLRTPDLNRIDLLMSSHKEFFAHGPVILYAPTFRDDDESYAQWMRALRQLAQAVEDIDATLIVKTHLREHEESAQDKAYFAESDHVIFNPEVDTLDLLAIVDHVITDYSGVSFEAAVAGKPLWFYIPDYADYRAKRGLNFDLRDYLPDACFDDPVELLERARTTSLPTPQQEQFLQDFVALSPRPELTSSKQIARLILKGIQ